MSTPSRGLARRSLRVLIALAAGSVVLATALPAYASNAGLTDAQRLALAHRETASLLSAAPLPVGSRAITAAVAETTKPFTGDKSSVYGGNEVATTKFFVAPSAATSISWLKGRPLSGHEPTSGSSGVTYTQVYMLNDTSVLERPEVVYIGVTRANGTFEFSITASVWWRSQKSALAVVPAGATTLTVKLNRGLNAKKDRTSSVTTDHTSLIASIIAHINALPVASPLPMTCPMDVGASLTMSFYREGNKKPYSVVVADPSGCGPVSISQYNTEHVRTSVGDVAGGVALSKFVAGQLGLTNLAPT
ncbi:MAG: hypothetical protein ACRDVC_06395 [Acidimicrobiales bacterium]